MRFGELGSKGVVELARMIAARELSPVELTRDIIKGIEDHNGALNALVVFAFEEALDNARAAERALMAGDEIGPLHGIPYALKDCFDFKPGWRNTFGGVPALKDYVSDAYSLYPQRADRAGAIAVGKTNSPSFGFRGTCDNFLFGPTRNPFNLALNSGGSSGGAAAAVAAGLLPFAEGGDGGGSIRIPAAWCGVYGFKQSFGRLPLHAGANRFSGINPFIFEGSLTRSVADTAYILGALAGEDPADPLSYPSHGDFMPATRRSIRGMRIAYSPNLGIHGVDPVITGRVADAVRAFEEAGAIVEQVELDLRYTLRELSDLWCRLIVPNSLLTLKLLQAEGHDLLRDHPEDLPWQFHEWLECCRPMTILQHLEDQAMRSEVFATFQNLFEQYDLLACPTVAAMPVANAIDGNTVGPSSVAGRPADPLIGWCMTFLFNLTGHPAASVPAGLSPDGLPVGLQLIGRARADADILAASAAFEQLRPWASTYRICHNLPAVGATGSAGENEAMHGFAL